MKYIWPLIFLAIIIFSGFYFFSHKTLPSPSQPQTQQSDIPQTTILAQDLDTPWALAFLPDKSILVTERAGRVQRLEPNGTLTLLATLPSKEVGEGGLLGVALDPQFEQNHFVYFYYTYAGTTDTLNRVVRMIYQNNTLTDEEIIVDAIPGNSNHNGGRIKFGPDGLLYIATGDAENPSQAQDTSTLGGKILRITREGKAEVFSYGHRNVQGLTWDNQGNLWATEHGRSGVQSGLDELNLIEKGKNYGWPTIQGNETRSGMETAIRNSGSTTWAPAGIASLNNSLFFGGLRGQTLYQVVLQGNQVTEMKEHFKNQFGRIREVIVGPDGMLYITTSNRDGRGTPNSFDDKIIRINSSRL